MSDLRFFADLMHEAIANDTARKRFNQNVDRYRKRCEEEREANLPRGCDRIPEAFHKANEGLCAIRILTGGN